MGVHARVLLLAFTLFLVACGAPIMPTRMALAPTVDLDELEAVGSDSTATVPPTWTIPAPGVVDTATAAPTLPPPATSTPQPTVTAATLTETEAPIVAEVAMDTATPEPTAELPTVTLEPPTITPIPPTATLVPATATPLPAPPTDTPIPPPPATATPPPQPVLGVNLLPNPSFEQGHYNSGGVAELQVPNGWIFEWNGGTNPFVSPPDDYFVRPETRVLPHYQLPTHEQPLFIFDGQYTMKIFKGYWAINVQLVSDVFLEPGTYALEINVFPDLVVGYDGSNKIWAPDPTSGEVRFVVTGAGTDWFYPAFGQKNTFTHIFTVPVAQNIRVGAGFRNRYGLMNNGWFIDNWSLKRIENP